MFYSKNTFETKVEINKEDQIIFVSDLFQNDYLGGAELTSEALIEASSFKINKIHARDVTLDLLEQGKSKFWIFGNFSQLDVKLIPTIVANLSYSILEYDYKYCKYRSPEKHADIEMTPCDCHNTMHGKMISAFFYGAKSLWWMSEKQLDRYLMLFPFLEEKSNCVLSSVFNDETFFQIQRLRKRTVDIERKGWIVLGSSSWIKGMQPAEEWCKATGKDYKIIMGVSHSELLQQLALAEGHVYLPPGGDTCPRMVIEAKLLGCKLHLNSNVQHATEEWFDTDDMLLTESYLYSARERFWNGIKDDMKWNPQLSGYTTTRNCVKQNYPFEECIQSMMEFCDEVCIVDGDSTDGTWNKLVALAHPDMIKLKDKEQVELIEDIRAISTLTKSPGTSPHQQKLNPSKIKLMSVPRDWDNPRFAVYDGMQKAEARKMCSKEFCWQMDSDEIVHEDDYKKIRSMLYEWPANCELLALPVVEYWGSKEKVRCDIMPWKWRISKNLEHITHGIPAAHRKLDQHGELYSLGSDGCDLINSETFDPINHLTFYTPDVETARCTLNSNDEAFNEYHDWYNSIIKQLPTVYHFSWWNIERKIHTYKNYWQKHWNSLFNTSMTDLPKNNMFFDSAWSDITDTDITNMAKRLAKELGGWIFHRRVDFTKSTKYITLDQPLPKIIHKWADNNAQKD